MEQAPSGIGQDPQRQSRAERAILWLFGSLPYQGDTYSPRHQHPEEEPEPFDIESYEWPCPPPSAFDEQIRLQGLLAKDNISRRRRRNLLDQLALCMMSETEWIEDPELRMATEELDRRLNKTLREIAKSRGRSGEQTRDI